AMQGRTARTIANHIEGMLLFVPMAQIHFLRTDGSSALPALEIGLGQVLITKVEHVFDPDPQQQISLLFGKVQWLSRSASGQTQFACWDMVRNKACSTF
ncbi:MAG: hypothetical protein AAF628_36275, partial [Planctomycetota bacterium]